MQTRLLTVVLGMLLLAGAITAFLLGRADDAALPAAAPESRPTQASAPAQPDSLASPRVDPQAGARVSVEGSEAGTPSQPAAAAAAKTIHTTFVGRFLDSAGEPLAGVEVFARYVEGRTRSGDDGRFRLELELREGQKNRRVPVLTRLAGYESRLLQPEAWVERPYDLGDIVLGSGGTLLCTVVDEGHRPVASVRVLGTPVQAFFDGPRSTAPPDSFVEGETDGSGRCLLEGIPEGDVRIWAGAEDSLWAYQEVRVLADRQSEVELLLTRIDERDMIEIVVLAPDGSPVPSARIQYHYQSEGHSGSGGATADDEGRYRHLLKMRVPHDFSGADPQDRYRPGILERVPPGARGWELQLQEARALTVAVSDLEGAPIASFRVSTLMIAGEQRLPSQRVVAEPEDEGAVQVLLPTGPFEAGIEADGYQSELVGPLDPRSVGARLAVRLTPLPGVLGRVLDEAGQPVPGATVSLHRLVAGNAQLTINGFPCRSQKGASASGKSEADGSFRLNLRESGRFVLRCEADGFAPAESGELQLEAQVGARGLEVELGRGGGLHGKVLMPPGESAAGVIVGISRGDGFGETVRSDALGEYRFELLTPGRWLVERRSELLSRSSTSSSTSDSDGPAEIPWNCEVWAGRASTFDLDLRSKQLVVIDGQLSFSGTPCAGWNVRLYRRGDKDTEVAGDTLDSQGRFRLSSDDAGEFRLQFLGSWKEPPFLFLLQDLELWKGVLDWKQDLPIGRLEGHVAPGLLSAEAKLSLSLQAPDGIRVLTSLRPDADGGYRMPGVPAGSGRLSLSDSQVEAKSISVPPGGTLRVDFP